MPTHYIQFHTAAESFAKKYGNIVEYWQKSFFEDLFLEPNQIRYLKIPDTIAGDIHDDYTLTICIVGKKWCHWGKQNDIKPDHFYVVRSHERAKVFPPNGALPKKQLVFLSAEWKLFDRTNTQSIPTADPLPPPLGKDRSAVQLIAPIAGVTEAATLVPELENAIMNVVSAWPAEKLLPQYASARSLPGDLILERMRDLVLKHNLHNLLPSHATQRHRNILKSNNTKPAPGTELELHRIFGISLIENIYKSQRQDFADSLASLMALPPTESLLQAVVILWVQSATSEIWGRFLEVIAWLSRAENSSEQLGWLPLLEQSSRQHLLVNLPHPLTWDRLRSELLAAQPRLPPNPPDPMGQKASDSLEPGLALISSPPEAAEGTTPDQVPATNYEPKTVSLNNPESSIEQIGSLIAVAVSAGDSSANTALPQIQSDEAQVSESLALREPRPRLVELYLADYLSQQHTIVLSCLQTLQDHLAHCAQAASQVADPTILLDMRSRYEAVFKVAEQGLAHLPDESFLSELVVQLEQDLGRLQRLGERGISAAWLWKIHSAGELSQVLSTIEDPLIDALPRWFLAELVPSGTETELLVEAAIHPYGRSQLQAAAQILREPDVVSDALAEHLRNSQRTTYSPPVALDALKFVLDTLRRGAPLRERFAGLGPWVEQEWERNGSRLEWLTRQLKEVETTLLELQALVSEAAQYELADVVRQALNLQTALDLVGTWAERLRQIPDRELLRTFTSLQQIEGVWRVIGGANPVAEVKPVVIGDLEIDHCISSPYEEKTEGKWWRIRAAKLYATHADANPSHGRTSVPIALRWNQRADVRLAINYRPTFRSNISTPQKNPTKFSTISVNETEWRRTKENQYTTEIVIQDIEFPKRLDGSRGQLTEFSLEFSGHDINSRAKISVKSLKWEAPRFDAPTYPALPFSDTTSTEEMISHPLGIQRCFDEILEVMQAARASFVMYAPRRFGKTTLLRALYEKLPAAEVVALPPVVVTLLEKPTLKAAFDLICERLETRFPEYEEAIDRRYEVIPDPHTFDGIRRYAYAQGIRAIYLLFDEAQALFANLDGKIISGQLKDLFENYWGRPEGGMASLYLGFVGQYHLGRLVGDNFRGMFPQSYSQTEIEEAQLEGYLRRITGGLLQSSSSARQEISRISTNILVLREVLKDIYASIRQLSRTWFIFTDVQESMARLVDRAIDEPNNDLAAYLRDPLNASENKNDWHPIASYPVAIAWAVVLEQHREEAGYETLCKAAQDWLSRWLLEYAQHGWMVPRESLSMGLQELTDVNVLNRQLRFRSPMLQRYMARLGQSNNRFNQPVERQTLLALVVERVQLPEQMQPIGAGGQAKVFRAKLDGRDVAIRITDLSGEEDYKTFVSSRLALKALLGSQSRFPGQEHLPVVRKAGFSTERTPRGIIVYDFIAGNDLAGSIGLLHDSAVIKIGRALAQVLTLLHHRDVVHCDIRPENILLGEAYIPFLVDFGLARRRDQPGQAPPAHTDYLAPEVRQEIPDYSSKSDVYALCMTLERLRRQTHRQERLTEILGSGLAVEAERRSSADELSKQFNALFDDLHIREQHEARQHAFSALIQQTTPWVQTLSRRYLGDMAATALGLVAAPVALTRAAHLCDEIFADWQKRRYGEVKQPHLTALDPAHRSEIADPLARDLSPLITKEAAATGWLRHADAHGENVALNRKRAMNVLGIGGARLANTDDEFWQAVLLTAQRLESIMSFKGFYALIDAWFSGI